jgi:hypothetical protein
VQSLHSSAGLCLALVQLWRLLPLALTRLCAFLQGEVANIIAQLSAGSFKWQEFVMGLSMLAFLISLKHIQRK